MKLELIDHVGPWHSSVANPAKKPNRAKPMDVGADVYAPKSYILAPQQTVTVGLALGVKIPNGYAGFIYPRSSLAVKGLVCHTPPIDPSYTGEVHAILTNTSKSYHEIKAGDRIGQLVVLPCVLPEFVTEPLETRGDNAFGSTGS